jgi:hypothetical protein
MVLQEEQALVDEVGDSVRKVYKKYETRATTV